MNKKLVLVAGCYEKVLFGYYLEHAKNSKTKGLEFQSIFVNLAHDQSIRCIASTKNYFVTGSADHSIK